MDYKQKYNKLVEAIKVLQETNPSDEGIQNWVNDNVPELAESKDEKKELKKVEQKPDNEVKPFDELGFTDFERTLTDICIGWIGKEMGWEQYIKDNAYFLLRIAVEKFKSVQDACFEQKPAFLDILEVKDIRNNLWKPADGNDLPEIDREVIVLLNNNKVCYAHRPPEYWDGKNIATGKVIRCYPVRYDGGGWNIPGIKWWLDLELPKMEE